jgi:hypothetical protein
MKKYILKFIKDKFVKEIKKENVHVYLKPKRTKQEVMKNIQSINEITVL